VIILDEPTAAWMLNCARVVALHPELNEAGHTIVLTRTIWRSRSPVRAHRHAQARPDHLARHTRNLLKHVSGVRVRLRLQPTTSPRRCAAGTPARSRQRSAATADYAAIESMLGVLREGGVAVQDMEVMQADSRTCSCR